MQYLDRKTILGTLLKSEVVEVPEWGGHVVIKELSAADALVLGNMEFESTVYQLATYLIHSLYDDKDNKLFSMDDLEALTHCSFNVLNRLSDIVLRLSNLSRLPGESKAEEDEAGN